MVIFVDRVKMWRRANVWGGALGEGGCVLQENREGLCGGGGWSLNIIRCRNFCVSVF